MAYNQSLTLSDSQAFTTQASHDSTNSIDFGSGVTRPNSGGQMRLQIVVQDAVTSDGSATVTAKLQDSADGTTFADVTVNGLTITTGAVAKATLVAGYKMLDIAIPPTIRRYAKVVYTVGTAALTAGSFSAAIRIPKA